MATNRHDHLLFKTTIAGVTATWSATAAKSAKADANSKKTAKNSSSNAKQNTAHAGSAECPSTTTHHKTPQTIHTTSTTSTRYRRGQTSNTTPQASAHHTPNATTCEATKTQPHQSAHSHANGSKQHKSRHSTSDQPPGGAVESQNQPSTEHYPHGRSSSPSGNYSIFGRGRARSDCEYAALALRGVSHGRDGRTD